MESATTTAEELRRQIRETEQTLEDLRQRLHTLEASEITTAPPLGTRDAGEGSHGAGSISLDQYTSSDEPSKQQPPEWPWPLAEDEYMRYGRQLILPSVGIRGQLRLKGSSVLVVGAGGLGCPAAAYLAGAGVGTLGVVDGDTVEASNLHRQIAHSTARLGQHKVHSLVAYCRDLNPLVTYTPYAEHLTPQNAPDIVSQYDIVLDCTDHPTSRYLISDICVLLGKPLVSASALRTDGQLIVLNDPPGRQGDVARGGPCYRCVFPRPPPADSVVSCGEGGILGPVVGVMGVLQALEAIKLVAAGINKPTTTTLDSDNNSNTARTSGDSNSGQAAAAAAASPAPSLLLFSAGSGTSPASFRSIRMRGRRKDCFACSPSSTLTLDTLRSGSLDYIQFCGVTAPIKILTPEERVSALEYSRLRPTKMEADPQQQQQQEQEQDKDLATTTKIPEHILLDVREREHFDIASLPGAINVPFSKFQAEMRRRGARTNTTDAGGAATEQSLLPAWLLPPLSDQHVFSGAPPTEHHLPASADLGQDGNKQKQQQQPDIYVICRLGNDSQVVARQLQELLLTGDDVKDAEHAAAAGPDKQRRRRRFIGDVQGGMAAWKRDVDGRMPFT
ncbi:uncharacterized protein B0I36DRAFT_327425 [Microdochium trichocladiopsis]|uniref:Adenylyltransferase and sulfurtransferase uba4 n=1 Tax=Microdochium trichocladiopsis TaxID=1682393 RepID=A0A9P8Y4Q9_9PEZI|nr:uncharacterized protein B0I36DRAFT_327425 [Microdochium trichocladiopsis]KAH7027590.1 hypothetical protein B0I36DRAFT_327425 [Microdochium trichocladiopsis]